MVRRLVVATAAVLAMAAVAALVYRRASVADLVDSVMGPPHARYAAWLKLRGGADTPEGRRWLASADQSLSTPMPAASGPAPLSFGSEGANAYAFAFAARRGQRYVARAISIRQSQPRIFLDLFRAERGRPQRLASAPSDAASLSFDVGTDGDYLLRVQPELAVMPNAVLEQRLEPTLCLPVAGATAGRIQSGFGAARDHGARRHEGVDIFAPRGTPVVAAAAGLVSSVGTNRLGGKVVWEIRPTRGEALYYAHLDEQTITAGTYVRPGDVLGTVGTTGNARGGPPHLHFGIYSGGHAVDPLPYVAPVRGQPLSIISSSLASSSQEEGPGTTSCPRAYPGSFSRSGSMRDSGSEGRGSRDNAREARLVRRP